MRFFLSLVLAVALATAAAAQGLSLRSTALVARATPASGVPADYLLSFEAGSAGDLVTTSLLSTASTGAAGTFALDHHNPLEHTKITAENVPFPVPFLIGGASYDGSGTRAVKFDLDLARTNASTPIHEGWFRYPTAADITEASYALVVRFDLTSGVIQTDIDFINVNLGKFCVPQVSDSGGWHIRQHNQLTGGSSSPLGDKVPIEMGTPYIVMMLASTTRQLGVTVVLDTDLNFIGATAAEGGFDFALAQEEYHDYLLTDDPNGAGSYTIFNSAAAYGANARIDMQPFTVPAAASVGSVQTAAGTIVLTFDNVKVASYKIERAANGGSWVVQSGTQDWSASTVTYTDTGLTAGVAYQYRVTPQVVTLAGAPATGPPVTIDNTPFGGAFTDTISSALENATEGADSGTAQQAAITLPAGTVNKLHVRVMQSVGSSWKLTLFDSAFHPVASGTSAPTNVSFGSPDWVEASVTSTALASGSYYIGATCSNALGVFSIKSGSGSIIYDFATGYAGYPPGTMVNQGTATNQMIAGAYIVP